MGEERQAADPARPDDPAPDELSADARRAFGAHAAAQLIVDPADQRVLGANAAALRFFGAAPGGLRGAWWPALVADDPGAGEAGLAALARGECERIDVRHRGEGGQALPARVLAARVEGPGGAPRLHLVIEDRGELERVETELRDYETIFRDVPIPFYRSSPGAVGRFLRCNQAMIELLEAESLDELLACDVASLYVDPSERERFSETLMRDGAVRRYDLHMRTLKGRAIRAADTAYQHLDTAGNRVIDGILEDVTTQRALEERLAHQARHDALTGLINRGHGDVLLRQEIDRADRYVAPLSALMLDLDHFKQVNDRLGHAAGDELLVAIVAVFAGVVRQTDVLVRWGGEEFLALLPSTPIDGAARLAEKLRAAVARLQQPPCGPVTLSAGFGQYRRGEGKHGFLARLDAALYEAKRAGRDRVARAEPVSPGP